MIGIGLSPSLVLRRGRVSVLSIQPAHLLAYWMQAEASGTALDSSGNGRTGTYTSVTLGQPGIGDGRTSALYTSSYCNVYSTSLRDAFSGAEGSLGAWMYMSAGSTGATRRSVYLAADASNRVFLGCASNGQITASRQASGTSQNVVKTIGEQVWVHVAITWSVAADQLKVYFNGVQEGATLTGLTAFAGTLAATTTLLGATSTVPANPWTGRIAHVAVWDTPLTASEVALLAL